MLEALSYSSTTRLTNKCGNEKRAQRKKKNELFKNNCVIIMIQRNSCEHASFVHGSCIVHAWFMHGMHET